MKHYQYILGVIGGCISLLCILMLFFGLGNAWQNTLLNRLFINQKNIEVSNEIVILGIDDSFVARYGIHGAQNRSLFSSIFEKLEEFAPKAVGVDYIWRESTSGIDGYSLKEIVSEVVEKDLGKNEIGNLILPFTKVPHPSDMRLTRSIESLPNVVIAADHTNAKLIEDGKLNSPVLRTTELEFETNPTLGMITALLDSDDSIVRKYYTTLKKNNGAALDSFALAIAKQAGVDPNIPVIDRNKRMYINYFGHPGAYTHVSAVDLLEDKVPSHVLENKIVLLGATSPRLNDIEHTPIAPDAQMAGVEIHANALQTILEGKFLVDEPFWLKGLIILLMTSAATCSFYVLSVRTGVAIFFVLSFAYYVSNQLMFKAGVIMDQIFPYLALVLSLVTVYIYKYFTEHKERTFISDAFGSYVSPEILTQIQNDPSKLELGGEEKIVTVLFSDIRNFTNISERLSANSLVALLNEYFSAMSQIVIGNKGTVDKFEGDAIMAYFGAPLPLENHALYACKTALEMQKALADLRYKFRSEGKPELHCRIGINTGPVVAGNVGSKDRFDYTVMGDTVNLGSRLEGANKYYGSSIMIGEDTYQIVKDHLITRLLDKLRVKGKDHPVMVYEVLGISGDTPLENFANQFNEAMALYFNRDFQSAKLKFEQCLQSNPEDGPSKTFLNRCNEFLTNTPGPDWNGVYTLKGK